MSIYSNVSKLNQSKSATRFLKGSRTKALCAIVIAGGLLAGCQSSPFKKDPVPEPIYVPNMVLGPVETLTIAQNKVPCQTPLPMLCLVASQSSGDVFQIPYDWVAGFKHTNGIRYVIEAQPQFDTNKQVENKMQARTGHWVLNSVVTQEAIR